MAVFTRISREQLSAWLARYAVGELLELRGIAAGIENSNYFVSTTQGRYVLTVFERLGPAELPFYLDLMAHLAAQGIPCPAPVPDRAGTLYGPLQGKPATLVTRLSGEPASAPTQRHCEALGAMLARMHLAGRSYRRSLANPRGRPWWQETAARVMAFLDPPRSALLCSELAFQLEQNFASLPRGPIHADLFRDNVLFEGNAESPRLAGVLDFYFAGVDALLFDCAVAVNDWCIVADGQFDAARTGALLGAYARARAFGSAERDAWPAMLRAAALRFWLSRLDDFYCPRPGELIHAHDPEHFRRILELRRTYACTLG
jgi:homoserine kinase type II